MKMLIRLCVVLIISLCFYPVSQAQTDTGSVAYTKAQMMAQAEENRLVDLLDLISEDPENTTYLIEAGFLSARIGNRISGAEQTVYFHRARDLAQRALDQNPQLAQAHFVMAVALGRIALVSSAQDRMAASGEIKKHIDKALAYDSTLAGAWHILGLWQLKMANMSEAERMAATALFGQPPEAASNTEAVQAFKKAVALDGDYLLYRFDLARACIKTNDTETAARQLQLIGELPATSADDFRLQKKSAELLGQLKWE